jgi:Rrf2 family protein
MISQKARYALRALLYLAAKGGDTPVQIAEIAEAERLPRKFLEQILLELKKPGIVRSHRGRSGGYSLGRSPKDISFADVLRVTDGPLALSPCVSVMAYRKCDDCFEESVCAIRKALLAARDATAEILESRNLATASAQLKRSGAL